MNRIGWMLYQIIAWALVALCLGMIFSFSAQGAEESSSLSLEFTDVIAQIVAPHDGLDRQSPSYAALHRAVRKGAHMTEYALLAMLLTVALAPYPFSVRRKLLFALALCATCAGLDEWRQGFSLGRAPAVTDVLIDALGAAVGLALALAGRQFVLWITRHGVIRAK